jgi:GNAT superfamily N-acetyltransferase
MDQVRFSFRLNEPLSLLKEKYQRFGYESEILEDDVYLLAYDGHEIIAIVRVSTEHDTAVLRGMFMDKKYHRQGIGRKMLEELSTLLNQKYPTCYCIPYSHLEGFYSLIGFEKMEQEKAPSFIQKRIEGYLNKKMDIILMKRVTT